VRPRQAYLLTKWSGNETEATIFVDKMQWEREGLGPKLPYLLTKWSGNERV